VASTRAPENVGENHDIHFKTPFTLRLIGVRGGGASTPPKVDLVKIRAKSLEIWAKCMNTFAKSLYML